MVWLPLLILALAAGGAPPAGTPEAVVQTLYAYIVKARPLGIPRGADRAALWPLLTSRLARVLETGQRCEEDYFRQHPPRPDSKPEFDWLEEGLFSGPDEMALPSEVRVVRTDAIAPPRYRVLVEFTYREPAGADSRPPNPADSFEWRGEVIVDGEHGRFLVDDFRRIVSSGERPALSHVFAGCRGARWVGDGE